MLCLSVEKPIPVAYPGFQREGCLRSGPIQKVGGRFRSDIRKVGGGALQVRYTKSGGGGGGGGGGRFTSDIRKVGGGGHGCLRLETRFIIGIFGNRNKNNYKDLIMYVPTLLVLFCVLHIIY